MRMNHKQVVLVISILLIVGGTRGVYSQVVDNEFQLRTSAELTKKIIKNLKLEVTPELRWGNGQFLDEYMLNTGLRYKAFDFLSFSAQYRFIGNIRDGEATEYLGRYEFNTQLSKKFSRWEPGLKLAYTNYTDDEEDGTYLKYKAGLGYDIADCKLTPDISFIVYHDLTAGNIYKYRTKLGVAYKLKKGLALTGAYKFDYYMTKSKNRHIFEVGLKVKL